MPSVFENVDWARLQALGTQALRYGVIGIFGLVTAMLVAVLVLFVALQIAQVRAALGERMLAMLADGDGITIELEGYGGVWPVRLRAETLTVRDRGVLIAQARNLNISWSPFALLGGLVHVNDLTVESIVLSALPSGADRPDDPPGPLVPSLPVDVRVDALSLPDIEVAAGIAGDGPILLAARGHAVLAGGGLQTDISVQRTDGGVFDLAIQADINPDTDVFDADVSLTDGAPGTAGLIAALTGLPDLGIVVVKATASGPANDWAARTQVDVGRMGKFDLSLKGDRRQGETVFLDAAFAPGAALGDLPTPLGITASVTHRRSVYELSNINAVAGEAGFVGQVRITDPLDTPRVLLDGTAINVSSVLGATVPDVISASADVTADAAFSQVKVAAMDIEADGLVARFSGAIDTVRKVTEGSLDLQTDDVRPLATLAGVDADGGFELRANLDALTFDGGFDGEITAELRPVHLPVAGLLEVVGESVTLDGQFASLAPLSGTRIETLSIVPASGLFALGASGDVSSDTIDVRVALTAQDIAPFSSLAGTRLSGRASLETALAGVFDQVSANSTLDLSAAQVSGVSLEGVAKADLLIASGVEGPLAFTGRVADVDADIRAELVSRDGSVGINDIAARVLDMDVVGDASLQPGGALTGELDGDVTSLQAMGRVLGMSLDGSGAFKVTSIPDDTGNRLTAQATLRRISADGVQVQRVGLTGSVSPTGRIVAEAELRRTSFGTITVANSNLDVSGIGDRLDATVGLTGISTFEDQNGTGTLDLAALYESASSRVTLSKLKGVIAGEPIELSAPAVISLDNGARVEGVVLALGTGAVRLDARQGAGSIGVATTIENAPLALLVALAGQTSEVRGTVSGDMSFEGSGTTGKGVANVKVAPVPAGAVAANDVSELLVFLIDGNWDGRSTSVRVTADMPGAEDLVATASLPLRARNGRPTLARGATLDSQLQGTLDLGAIWPLLPLDGHVMTGLVEMDLTARGALADMDIAGTARMRGGSYEGLETGVILTPLEITLVAKDGRADIRVETRDGATGILNGEGHFDLRDSADDRLRVALDMTSFRVLGREDLSALASGDIQVVWPRGQAGTAMPLTVGGAMTIERLEARIPDQLASDVETIEVTRVSADGERIDLMADNSLAGDTDNEPAPIELAFAVEVPRAAFVRGRGLESEWAGKLDVAGPVAMPELQGAFEVQRGTFDFLGQSFDVAGGRVEFTGGEEIDPYLDVEAVYEDDDFQAIVTITGLSSSPTLEVSSVPALPQDEILARVLFGTGTGQLTAFQAVQLADAAATLAGASSGGGVLDTMRRALGVDVLSVGEGGVEVGSYVRDGVYVGVSQGLDAGSGEVNVEVELTDEISLESDVGTTGDTRVGVTWGRDY